MPTDSKNPAEKQNDDWREELRGTYGNTGRMSRAGYNLGGLGAGVDGSKPPAEDVEASAAQDEESAEAEGNENQSSSRGRWAEHFGPRGFSGGFAGHDYDWTRRGEKKP